MTATIYYTALSISGGHVVKQAQELPRGGFSLSTVDRQVTESLAVAACDKLRDARDARDAASAALRTELQVVLNAYEVWSYHDDVCQFCADGFDCERGEQLRYALAEHVSAAKHALGPAQEVKT